MSAILAALLALAVFIVSQFVLKLVIEPIAGVSRAKGDLLFKVRLYSQTFMNPGTEFRDGLQDEAARELRTSAAKLQGAIIVVPRWVRNRVIRDEDLKTMMGAVIGLSNAVYRGDPERSAALLAEFEKSLGVPPTYEPIGEILARRGLSSE